MQRDVAVLPGTVSEALFQREARVESPLRCYWMLALLVSSGTYYSVSVAIFSF